MRQIGPSVPKNFLRMIFMFQLRTYFQHPCGIKRKTNIRTISPFPANNGVTLYPPWRWKITESNIRLKSKYLRPLRQCRPILILIHLQRCLSRRGKVMLSCQPTIIRVIKTPSIKVFVVTMCCARMLEFLRESINHIAQKIALEKVPTSNPSIKAWKGA